MTHESGQRSRSKAVALNQRIPVEAEDEGTPPETASHRLTGAREDPVERLATSLSAETPPLSGDAAGMSRRFPPQSTLSLPDDIRWQPAGLDLGDPEAFSLRNDTDLAAELARDLELLEEASRGFESSLIREGGKPVEARSPQDAERVQLNESPRQTTKQDVGLGGQHNTEAVGSGERPHAHQEHAPTKPSHQEPVSMKTKSSSSVASDPPIANRQDSLSTSGDAGLAGRREEQAEQLQKMKDDNT